MFTLLALGLVLSSCRTPAKDVAPDAEVDVAVIFDASVTDAEISDYIDSVLSRRDPDVAGFASLPGVQYVGGDYSARAVYLNFAPDARGDQKAAVMAAIERHLENVQSVEHDVVPERLPPR